MKKFTHCISIQTASDLTFQMKRMVFQTSSPSAKPSSSAEKPSNSPHDANEKEIETAKNEFLREKDGAQKYIQEKMTTSVLPKVKEEGTTQLAILAGINLENANLTKDAIEPKKQQVLSILRKYLEFATPLENAQHKAAELEKKWVTTMAQQRNEWSLRYAFKDDDDIGKQINTFYQEAKNTLHEGVDHLIQSNLTPDEMIARLSARGGETDLNALLAEVFVQFKVRGEALFLKAAADQHSIDSAKTYASGEIAFIRQQVSENNNRFNRGPQARLSIEEDISAIEDKTTANLAALDARIKKGITSEAITSAIAKILVDMKSTLHGVTAYLETNETRTAPYAVAELLGVKIPKIDPFEKLAKIKRRRPGSFDSAKV